MAESLSEKLRKQYDDIVDLYNDAKQNDNTASMERLSKLSFSLAKQIKEQEIHEEKMVPVTRVNEIRDLLMGTFARSIKKHLDPELGPLVHAQVDDDLTELIGREL
jgi:hypothetical protein